MKNMTPDVPMLKADAARTSHEPRFAPADRSGCCFRSRWVSELGRRRTYPNGRGRSSVRSGGTGRDSLLVGGGGTGGGMASDRVRLEAVGSEPGPHATR